MNDEDHTLLARIDERVATLIDAQNATQEWMQKQDDRICQLEACQNRWIGRDGAIVVGLSALISLTTAKICGIFG